MTRGSPRVLVVLAEPPLVEGGAPGRCAVALLRGLRAHGVRVEALAVRSEGAWAGEPPADLEVDVVDVALAAFTPASRLEQLRRPHDELARSPFHDLVRERARRADVVHVEAIEAASCTVDLPVPTVLHIHYRAHLDRSVPPPWSTDAREVTLFWIRERAAIRRSAWLLASSPRVAATLRRANRRARVWTAPLGLDPEGYQRAPLDGPPTVGLIGTAAWPPTAAAMRRLVREVWPQARAQVPDARLLVAGRGTEALGLAGPGVEVLGAVASSARFLAGLSVLTYPLARGSGVKVKVLEALACGLPVVTTRWGAEGLEAPGGLFVTAGDAASAALTARLLVDEEARRAAGRAARRAFEERYTPVRATASLPDLYRTMVGGGP